MITTCDFCHQDVPLAETRGLGEIELGYDVLTQCLDRETCQAAEAAYWTAWRAQPAPVPLPLPDDVPF